MSLALDRRTLLKASALGAGGLAVSTAVPAGLLRAAQATPPSPDFGPDIEDYASYDGQTQCIGVEQPGVAAFKSMILAAYPDSRNLGILRACGIGGISEHKEGRAWDWGVYANRPAEAASAQDVIDWLLASDRYGNRHANARRLGLMYMIWDRRIWKAYSRPDTWHAYTGSNPHTDHIHFSFGWSGARKETSFWGTAAPQTRLSWSGWTPTATGLASAPVATSWSSTRTDVFATSHAGTLVHRWMVTGRGWGPGSTWQDLGAPHGVRLNSPPAVVSLGEGLLNVFVRGDDRQLWRRSYRPGASWSSWKPLGGYCTSAPGAASWGPNHIAVVVRGGDGHLWERSWTGRWSSWSRIFGKVTTGPTVTSRRPGSLDLFARGSAHDLVHNVYDGGRWSGWMSRGGALAGASIAAASRTSGRLDVFVIGTNAHVYHKSYDGGSWHPGTTGWDHFDAPAGGAVDGLGTTSLHSDHLEVFARSADGRLYQRWLS